jgi:DNA-binding CsgD family transcriptional regulator
LTRHDTVQELVRLIYDAAVAPERWPLFLESLAEAMDAGMVGLVSHDFDSHRGGTSFAARLDPEGAREYNAHYHQSDPWARDISLFSVGAVIWGQGIQSLEAMRRTSYYHEFGRRYQLIWMMGVPLSRHGAELSTFLAANRGDRQEPFGKHEAALMSAIAPHAVRAVQITRRLAGAEHQPDAIEDVLNRLSVGLLLLSARGRVLFINQAARAIIAQRDGVELQRGEVTAHRREEAVAVNHMIAGATHTSVGEGLHAGGAIRISRPSGRPPYEALVTPLRLPRADGWPREAVAALFLTDPATRGQTAREQLERRFHLTQAESDVAAALAAGRSIAEITGRRRTTRSTTQWLVKQVLHKLGARNQSEVVRLFGSMPNRAAIVDRRSHANRKARR